MRADPGRVADPALCAAVPVPSEAVDAVLHLRDHDADLPADQQRCCVARGACQCGQDVVVAHPRRVFQIGFEDQFRYLNVIEPDTDLYLTSLSTHYRFDGRLRRNWKPWTVAASDERWFRPDIWWLVESGGGALVCSPPTVQLLGDVLHPFAQLLPLPVDGEDFELVNVTRVVNCFAPGSTVGLSQDDLSVEIRYDFDCSALPADGVFKVPETAGEEILVVEGDDAHRGFQALVTDYGIRGIFFRAVWDELSGPAQLGTLLSPTYLGAKWAGPRRRKRHPSLPSLSRH